MSNHDPFDQRSQDRAKADADTRAKLARESEESDLKWLLGNKRGRRIVWRLLDRAGVFRTSFNTNSMTMAFNEGMRNEGLRTLAQIHSLCPELYHVMVREATHDNRNHDDASHQSH